MLRRLTAVLHRFRTDQRANAATEFALIVPFLITLYMGSMEASALFTADKRVNSISATVGDLISQWDPVNDGTPSDHTIPTATLTSYFAAAKGLINPYPTANVKQVVSMVWVKADGTVAKVMWSQATGGATARTQDSSFTPLLGTSSTQMNTITRGGCVIASETTYSYKPLLGAVFTTALNLSHTNYFIPRYGATKTIRVAAVTTLDTACNTGVSH